MDNKILLYSTGNYIQYLVRSYKEKYMYNWVNLLYTRSQHNIVNQL